jgi:hypothetical protein
MRSRSLRRIRPGLEPLDRRDVPSSLTATGVTVGSAVVAPVAPGPTKVTYAAIGTLYSTQYPGETYQAVAIVTEASGSFTAKVQVNEGREYHTVEQYSVTGTIDQLGNFSGSGSGPDGQLTISGTETVHGNQRVLNVLWTVGPTNSPFDSGTGTLATPPTPPFSS